MSVHDEIIGTAARNQMLNAVPNGGDAAFNVAGNSVSPPTEPPIETETETFENPQTKRLNDFQRGYKVGYDDACAVKNGIEADPFDRAMPLPQSLEESEKAACDAIFSTALANNMSLSVAYNMAWMAAKHIDGSLQ